MFETALPEEFNFDLDLSNEIQDSTPPTLNTKPTDYEFES